MVLLVIALGKHVLLLGQVYSSGIPIDSLSYTSTDGGVTWTSSTTLFSDDGVLYAVACDSTGKTCTTVGTVYSGSHPGALSYTSTDGGESWASSTTQFDDGGALNGVAGIK